MTEWKINGDGGRDDLRGDRVAGFDGVRGV